MEEPEDHKSTIYELDYVGGIGVDAASIVNAATTPSADTAQAAFAFNGIEEGGATYLTTGLWRLRSQDQRLWQIPPSGSASLVPKDWLVSLFFSLKSFESMERGGRCLYYKCNIDYTPFWVTLMTALSG